MGASEGKEKRELQPNGRELIAMLALRELYDLG